MRSTRSTASNASRSPDAGNDRGPRTTGERLAAETITRRQGNKKGPVSRPPCPLRPASSVASRPAQAVTRNPPDLVLRSEEHTSELQSLMRISYASFCLKTKNTTHNVQCRSCKHTHLLYM